MLKFKIFLLNILIILIGTGCPGFIESVVKSDENEGCKESSFIVDEVTGTLSASNERTALPGQFTLDLHAKVRSKGKVETTLPNTFWAISNNQNKLNLSEKEIPDSANLDNTTNKIIKKKADGTGTISWTATHDYAYSRKSQWIVIHVYIKGLSNEYPGICKIPLAVNPWLQLEAYSDIQVADYRDIHNGKNNRLKGRVIKNGLDFLKQKKQEEEMHGVNVVAYQMELRWGGSKSIKARIFEGNTISAELQYSIEDVHGRLRENTITHGNFEIESHLLMRVSELDKRAGNGAKSYKERYVKVNANNPLIKTHFQENNSRLTSDPFDWPVPFVSTNETPFMLYIKIIPKGNTAKRLNAFEGVYYVGKDYEDTISGNIKILKLNAILGEKYRNKVQVSNTTTSPSKYTNHYNLTACLKNINYGADSVLESCISSEKTDLRMDGVRKAGWAIKKLTIRFFNMIGENWLERKISTIIETSVIDSNNRPISAKAIKITVIDLSTGEEKVVEKQTNDSGNIIFNISTSHKWYKRQRFFLKVIRFTTKESGDLQEEKIIAINPWDYGFTHGYEVNHPNDLRTTCLKEGEEEEADMDTLVSSFIKKSNLKTKLSDAQLETIKKFFCYKKNTIVISKEEEEKKILSIKEIFESFITTLRSIRGFEFKNKFKSSISRAKPVSYIHLFRAINKYPYYLIDDSLSRSIYYKVRFKFTPRVVRYDSIHRGQQDKGPIRDGIYILQMAVLKNNQGRFFGANDMVLRSEDTFSIASDTSIAGTMPLFTCPVTESNCITKEDFIIPPKDIPIVIFDGMIKEDIWIPIKRKHLLFANSKNILVFRILPADPMEIYCSDEGTKNCETRFSDVWNQDFDLSQIRNKIKPAKSVDYDMFFHTYKVPFIPSMWSNWNITKETDITFSKLKEIYKLSSQDISKIKNASDKRKDSDLVKTSELERVYLITNNPDRVSDNKTNLDCKNKQILLLNKRKALRIAEEYINDKEASQTVKDTYTIKISQLENEINAITSSSCGEQSSESPEADLLTREKCDQLLKSKILEQSYNQNAVAECQRRLQQPDKKSKNGVIPDSMANKGSDDSTPQAEDSCVAVKDSAEQTSCFENKQTPDMLNRHIDHFSSTNTLCTINIDSESSEPMPNYCGRQLDPAGSDASVERVTQEAFIDALNRQIDYINEVKKEIREKDKTRYRFFESAKKDTSDVVMKNKQDLIRHSFGDSYLNSKAFKNKLKNIPDLPQLNVPDLENIIRSDTVNTADGATGTFLHALCGFWFSHFLSTEYINAGLLMDSFRQAVKNTVYYKLRGIQPVPVKDTNGVTSNLVGGAITAETPAVPVKDTNGVESNCSSDWKSSFNKADNTHINCLVKEIEKHYKDKLKELNLLGQIDNLHKWVNNEYRVDSAFHKRLKDKFISLSQQNPMSDDARPVFAKNRSRVDVAKKKDGFDVTDYLYEAVRFVNAPHIFRNHLMRSAINDYHPVRKCISNPSHFFGIEKKIIVGKIGDESRYGDTGGEVTTIAVNEDFMINSQRDTGANQQFGSTLDSTLNLLSLPLLVMGGTLFLGTKVLTFAFPSILKGFNNIKRSRFARSRLGRTIRDLGVVGGIIAFIGSNGISGKADYSYRAYDGSGRRKLLSIRVSEGVNLKAEQTPLNIQLENHQECLVIRPRFSAFESDSPFSVGYEYIWSDKTRAVMSMYEKMGLLLCTQGHKTSITESYYYIYPDYLINGITMDPSSHRNKPFVVSIRGEKEYRKFKHSLSCYVAENTEEVKNQMDCRDMRGKYEYLASKHLEFAKNLKDGFILPKLFHQTEDSPGVYSIYKGEDRDYTAEKKESMEDIFYQFMRWGGRNMSADLPQYFKEDPIRQ